MPEANQGVSLITLDESKAFAKREILGRKLAYITRGNPVTLRNPLFVFLLVYIF